MTTIVAKPIQELPAEREQPANATSLLQAIERAAANPQADIEKMERLFAMHQKMVASEAEARFNAAMARVQAKIEPVAHNASNEQTHSRYAKLAAINKAIVPIYSAEGISISFDTGDAKREGWHRIMAKVSHAAGHTREYHIDLPPDDVGMKGSQNKTGVHAAGSTNMYGRRYLTCMIFNIATEDDDGNAGGGKVGMSDSQRADFATAIESAADVTGLENVWKSIAKACQTSGDREAYDTLKAAVAEKGKALKAKR